MPKSENVSSVDKIKRDQLAADIKSLRSQSTLAKQDNSIRFPTPEEEEAFMEQHRQFGIQKLYDKFQNKKINGIKVSDETISRNNKIIDSKLLEYYKLKFDSLLPPINSKSDLMVCLDQRILNIENIKKTLKLLSIKLVHYKAHKDTNQYLDYLYVFNNIYRKITDDIKALCENQHILMPDGPKSSVKTGYRLGEEGNVNFSQKLQNYRSEIYTFISDLSSSRDFFSLENIESNSKFSNLEDVSSKLIEIFKYTKDDQYMQKYQQIVESHPKLISISSYFSNDGKSKIENLVNGVLFGTQKQFDNIKLELQNSVVNKDNYFYLGLLFDKIIYPMFDLEAQGFSFRERVIELIASTIKVDLHQASTHFYKWLESKSLATKYGHSRVGDELIKYLETKSTNPDLVKSLVEKSNIYCLARYTDTLLENSLKNYSDKSKPYFLSIIASDDHTNVFDDVGKNIEKIQKSLGQDANVLITEASSYYEIIRFLSKRHKEGFKPPSVIHISAHGTQDGVFLSRKSHGEFLSGKIDDEKFKPFLNYLKKNNITIVLDSCLTGQGDQSLQKKAIQAGVSIVAPDHNINRGTSFDFEVDANKITVKKVVYQSIDAPDGKIEVYPDQKP